MQQLNATDINWPCQELANSFGEPGVQLFGHPVAHCSQAVFNRAFRVGWVEHEWWVAVTAGGGKGCKRPARTERVKLTQRTTRGRASLAPYVYSQEAISSSSCLNASLISALTNKFLSRSDSESPEKDIKIGEKEKRRVREQGITRFIRRLVWGTKFTEIKWPL